MSRKRCPGSNQLPATRDPWHLVCPQCGRHFIEGYQLAGKFTPIHFIAEDAR